MVSTSYFQRRHAGQHAHTGAPGVAARSRQCTGALPFPTLERASAVCRRGMALAKTPLNQSGVSA
jgi:hypothetical protein